MIATPQHIHNVPATFAQFPIPHIMASYTSDALLKDRHTNEYSEKVRNTAIAAIQNVASNARKQMNAAVTALESVMKVQIVNNEMEISHLLKKQDCTLEDIDHFKDMTEQDVEHRLSIHYDIGNCPQHPNSLSTNMLST